MHARITGFAQFTDTESREGRMFSGIVEAQSVISKVIPRNQVLEAHVRRPSDFNDLSVGDSVAVDGICLTVEQFNEEFMVFAIAAETLQITGWSPSSLQGREVNLERSLRFGDRLHGHLVTGHVDGLGEVVESQQLGESLMLTIRLPEALRPYVWKKGSVAVNGVSLTVNSVENGSFGLCLIPETLKRTNLRELRADSTVNLEVDSMARGLVHSLKLKQDNELKRVRENS